MKENVGGSKKKGKERTAELISRQSFLSTREASVIRALSLASLD